jgi:uncharacterized protein YjbI with pentapeptide repeats
VKSIPVRLREVDRRRLSADLERERREARSVDRLLDRRDFRSTDLDRRDFRSADLDRDRRDFRSADLDRRDFRSADLDRDRRDDFLLLDRLGDFDRRDDFFSAVRRSLDLDLDLDRRLDFLRPEDFRSSDLDLERCDFFLLGLAGLRAGLGVRDFRFDSLFLSLSLGELDDDDVDSEDEDLGCLFDSEVRRFRALSASASACLLSLAAASRFPLPF